MEALKFTLSSKTLELVKEPILKIENPDHLLVKVAYAGICGTDLHILEGEFPCQAKKPFTLGHEFCGTVVEIGNEVKTFKRGDRVVIDPNSGCNICHACHTGNPHYCKTGGIDNTIGIFRNGGWSEYASIPENQVFKLPDEITFEQAALTEPISCVAHGWDRISPVVVGQKILITGAGIIGALWSIVLHLQGHRKVTVSEPNEVRRELAQKMETGFEYISPDELKRRKNEDPDYVFDLVIDCSGFAPAIEYALTLLNRGGKLCIFGVAPPAARISVSPFQMYIDELKIIGVNINPFSFPNSIELLHSLGDRYLNYEKLGIKTFHLKNYKEAIENLKKGTIAKAVFKL